jgi:hypothetical protein
VLTYSPQNVVESLRNAKNLNAAVKNFLKREVGGDAKIGQFAKDLRAAFESRLPERAEQFVSKALPNQEIPLLSIVRYAYAEGLAQIVESIANEHADNFAKTYAAKNDGIELVDKKNFEAILTKVANSLGDLLTSQSIPKNNFMKNAVLLFLLEPEVFKAAVPLFQKLS